MKVKELIDALQALGDEDKELDIVVEDEDYDGSIIYDISKINVKVKKSNVVLKLVY